MKGKLNRTAEVIVIGAGIIGCSVAYYLAKKGLKVIVIEQNQGFCFGASGSNMGGLFYQLPESPICGFVREGIKLFENLSEEIDYNVEYERFGHLIVIDDEEQYPGAVKRVESMRTGGVNAQLLEGNEIRKLEPSFFGDNLIAGVADWESAGVNPFKVTYGFARAARKLGASFLLSTKVRKIETDKKDKIMSVVTDRGKIEAKFIVNATGAWAPEIGEMLGISIPIRPLKGQLLVTEPVPLNKMWRAIGSPVSQWATRSQKTVEEDKDPVFGTGGRPILQQESSGNWLVGTTHECACDNRVTMETIRGLARGAVKLIPKLKDVNCIRAYAGLRPHCYVDELPILGKVDSLPGLVLATGHASEGLMLAPLTGKLISELITENRTSMPIDSYSFSRFKNEKFNQTKVH